MKSSRKRKSLLSPNAHFRAVDPVELDEETAMLKRMRKSQLEAEFEENQGLPSELLMSATGAHDDYDDF
jgi:hypothetical protein